MTSASETVLGNARLVLADRVIEQGWIAFVDGCIAGFGEGKAPAGSDDAGGDLVMPGLIELHTDHLEAHYVPRPKVFWDATAAVVSCDGQFATCGITTVLDSLRVGGEGARKMSTAAPASSPPPLRPRVRPISCAPITSCICAAKSRCLMWLGKPGNWPAGPTCG